MEISTKNQDVVASEISGKKQNVVTVANEAKLYGDMCHKLSKLVREIVEIFPALEAVQPRKSGMQALCGLHWALDKAKALLQYCGDSSKLYLAITGDSILVKFEKVKDGLDQSLRRLGSVVPQDLAIQIDGIVSEMEQAKFLPNSSDQEAGNEIISLLQKGKEDQDFNALSELDVVDKVAVKLGIMSGKALLSEKKALKRLLDRARSEEDKKKELIVAYLLHLLRRYTKIKKIENTDDGSGGGGTDSYPPSPSERGSEASTSGRDSEGYSSEICYFDTYEKHAGNCSKEASSCTARVPTPPEEFRCPISLQLMSEPVIISSGQTYERVCIEKWFEEGHDTCPKTQQKLAHLSVTPNYCVKGLIASWCERIGIPIPDPPSPPPSPVTDWRWDSFSDSVSMKCSGDQLKGDNLGEEGPACTCDGASGDLVKAPNIDPIGNSLQSSVCPLDCRTDRSGDCSGLREWRKDSKEGLDKSTVHHEKLLADLKVSSLDVQCRAAEEVRLQTKDSINARSYFGGHGFIPALVGFLSSAVSARDVQAQETAALALLNLAVNHNRNKAEVVAVGAVPLLLKLFDCEASLSTKEAAVVVLLTISCLDENKPSIGASGAVSFLVDHLEIGSEQGVKDALTTLFNLSIFTGNRLCIIKAGAVPKLVHLLSLNDAELTEKCTTVLYNLASMEEGRFAIADTESGISALAEILDSGTPKEREQAAAILLLLCTNNFQHSQLVLMEGVIPSLVMLSVNGNPRGKDKAQKLLQHFREQRQKECVWHSGPCSTESSKNGQSPGRSDMLVGSGTFPRKSRSGPSFGFFRRTKSFSFYHC